MLKKVVSVFVCIAFTCTLYHPVQAQEFNINQLPVPGSMVGLSKAVSPISLKGIVVNPQKPLEFQFIVDTGSENTKAGALTQEQIKEESDRLVKYFLAGLTIPEGDLWVNLSPYEKDRIVPEALGQTDLGRDLLAQDYILKQLTASLIYPEKDLGKAFWTRVYAKAQSQFGTTDIPVNTFNKVWILPNQAQVFENGPAAYVTQSTLKVMLDEDYTALSKNTSKQTSNTIGSQIIREIVIPEIEKEVNTGKNFAPLRQIYQAMILAKWYKETIQNGLLDAVYTNKSKTEGVNLNDPAVKQRIYERYVQAYKKGVFNYIKEDSVKNGQTIPRKYFSGGISKLQPDKIDHSGKKQDIRSDGAMVSLLITLVGVGAAVVVAEILTINKVRKKLLSRIPPEAKDKRRLAEAVLEQAIELYKQGFDFEISRFVPEKIEEYTSKIVSTESVRAGNSGTNYDVDYWVGIDEYGEAHSTELRIGSEVSGKRFIPESIEITRGKKLKDSVKDRAMQTQKHLLIFNSNIPDKAMLSEFLAWLQTDAGVVAVTITVIVGLGLNKWRNYYSRESIVDRLRIDKAPGRLKSVKDIERLAKKGKNEDVPLLFNALIMDDKEGIKQAVPEALNALQATPTQIIEGYIKYIDSKKYESTSDRINILWAIRQLEKLGIAAVNPLIEFYFTREHKFRYFGGNIYYDAILASLRKMKTPRDLIIKVLAYRFVERFVTNSLKLDQDLKALNTTDDEMYNAYRAIAEEIKASFDVRREALNRLKLFERYRIETIATYKKVVLSPLGAESIFDATIKLLRELGEDVWVEALLDENERLYQTIERKLKGKGADLIDIGDINLARELVRKDGDFRAVYNPETSEWEDFGGWSPGPASTTPASISILSIHDKYSLDGVKDTDIPRSADNDDITPEDLELLAQGEILVKSGGETTVLGGDSKYGKSKLSRARVIYEIQEALSKGQLTGDFKADFAGPFKVFTKEFGISFIPLDVSIMQSVFSHEPVVLAKTGEVMSAEDFVAGQHGVRQLYRFMFSGITPSDEKEGVWLAFTQDAALTSVKGGIDLNKINVKRSGKTIPVQFNKAQLNELIEGGFEGFKPVITNFKYIQSPFQLLGVKTTEANNQLVKI